MYDMIIIGSGPAGLAAAIYGQRAKLSVLVIEKQPMSGGQIVNTPDVDNYPGMPGVGGFELASRFRAHADTMGAEVIVGEVTALELSGDVKKVTTEAMTYEGKTVVIATGATHRKLGVPGEEQLVGAGVSYCATCDGAFFRGKEVAVIGGGDVALEDALFLSRISRKVYLIHRRDELRGAKSLQEKVFEAENIEIIWDTVVEAIEGEGSVERLALRQMKTGEKSSLPVQGAFVAVGIQPNSDLFQGLVDMDESGYIQAGEDGVTGTPGVFVAGDVRTKRLRQVITAASDGANAVTSVEHYLYQ
ncbi:MAG: thioredoxin-disulfide reductase [Clostridiales bacterium]|nr:thioredoxin-disulfide reductase [Roseburia sp.]MDD7636443.1 thioredoxin-disulfide reductase [Clostridiales bacterium]MDY4112093.1 thioredoxin-disulfide reductase [Roseburia sp.]